MRKKTKWLALLISGLLVITSIAGCSSTSGTQPTAEPTKTAEPVTVSKFPEKPFEMLVPMGAGGGSDVFVRTLVKIVMDNKLSPQPIVVVNKPGGSGSIGWTYVAKDKKGDPYELSTVSSSFYSGPVSGQSPVSYKDFTHIIALCEDPNLILVAADSKYKTLKDLIDDAIANPKKINAGGASGQSLDAITFYAMSDKSGASMNYVPFEGGGDVITAVMGGHVTFGFLGPSEASSQIEAGKVRALAISTADRVTGTLSNIPTLKEQGYDIVVSQLRGVVAPSGISAEDTKYLEDMFKKAAATPEWKDFVAKNYMSEKILGSADFLKQSVLQNDLWTQYVSKIKK